MKPCSFAIVTAAAVVHIHSASCTCSCHCTDVYEQSEAERTKMIFLSSWLIVGLSYLYVTFCKVSWLFYYFVQVLHVGTLLCSTGTVCASCYGFKKNCFLFCSILSWIRCVRIPPWNYFLRIDHVSIAHVITLTWISRLSMEVLCFLLSMDIPHDDIT